jgi:AraC-like DNA-binding protein
MITLSGEEFWQLLQDYTLATQPTLLADPTDLTYLYPDWLGKGYKRNIELRNGTTITIHNYQLYENLERDCSNETVDYWEFVFNLASPYETLGGCRIEDGEYYLLGTHPHDCVWRELGGATARAVDIHLAPSLLKSVLEDYGGVIPQGLKPIVQENEQFSISLSQRILPQMQVALEQMIYCPYQGLTKQLYLEAKTLELIALQIQAASNALPSPPKPLKLKGEDIAAIYEARDILIRQFDNPPSLENLARQVGLNNRKLKEGFRQVFDTTVFGYLHQHRMQIAQHLLQQQQKVGVVAATVGYASPTSFSAAFQRQFGVKPKAYQLGRSIQSV